MTEPGITCPNCKTEIKLTESLAAPLIESMRLKLVQEAEARGLKLEKREAEIAERERLLLKAKHSIEATVDEKLEVAKQTLSLELASKARLAVADDLAKKERELSELHEILKTRDEKLALAQKAELEFLKKQRELDDTIRSTELAIERRVQDALTDIRGQALKEAEDQMKLKVREKEQIISSMQSQIEELKRRSDPSSAQLKGDVLELELEDLLRVKFPQDCIQRIAKGETGADLVQTVMAPNGETCGTILWESKRTKNWNDAWLGKLRDDQRFNEASIASIVSSTLPKDVETFALIDGVWVTNPRCMLPLAVALRQTLIEVASVRLTNQGQQSKMEALYQYLAGPRFRGRVEAIIENFHDMRNDLDKERKALTRLWAKREAQIQSVLVATSGMYGDMQGIAGRTLREIEALELLETVDTDSMTDICETATR